MKKLINAVEDIVPESLSGFAKAHPDIVKTDLTQMLVTRAGGPVKGKVALVSGGGSGHEPLHGGFVGLGMLDAAAAGHVFTSPVPDQVEAATRAVDGGAGVLHIVKNYTGDVLNFQMAAEFVAGEIEVAVVVTNDDVAVQDSLYTAGRRGVGGTVLVEKIAGAHAEAGGSLADVAATATKVNDQVRSMGMALTSCIVPAAGTPTFDLPDDEIEIGIGIHGEPGRRREKIAPVKDITRRVAGPDRRGPRAWLGRERPRLRQRHGRHAAHRALHRVRRRREPARGPRDHHHPLARGELHHEPGDGWLLDLDPAARRRAHRLLGRPGPHSRPALGRLSRVVPPPFHGRRSRSLRGGGRTSTRPHARPTRLRRTPRVEVLTR